MRMPQLMPCCLLQSLGYGRLCVGGNRHLYAIAFCILHMPDSPRGRLPDPRLLMFRRETITVWSYGPSEMAANGLSLVDVPEGHVTTALTPYTDSDSIPIEATVAHLPNKYCTPEFRVPKDFCQVSYENFILR